MKESDCMTVIKASIPEEQHIVDLLLSLSRSCNTFVTALTAKRDELDLNQLHQAFLNEEEKRKQGESEIGGGRRVDDGEYALRHNKLDQKLVKCHECQEKGHVIQNCVKKTTSTK